ncbi:hypothetical protein Bbelb_441400 [Branchiostoma belcheri]|nr:hypothetical protein Bbelb_441400 [Branchiostoma belcheri]
MKLRQTVTGDQAESSTNLPPDLNIQHSPCNRQKKKAVDNPLVVWRSSVFNVVPRGRALTMAGANGPLFDAEQFDHTPAMEGMGIQAPYHTEYTGNDGDCGDDGYGGATIPPWEPDNTSHTTSYTASTSQPLNNGSAFMQRPLATHETPTLGSRGNMGKKGHRPTSTGLYMRVNEQTVPFQRLRQAPHPKLNELQNSSRMKRRLTAGKGIGCVDKAPISSEYGSMYTKTYGAAPRSSPGSYKNKVYWYEDKLQKVTSKPLRVSSKAPV